MHLPHDHNHRSHQLQSELPREDAFATAADMMKLLSDPKRLQLYWLLCHCEECVINLSAMLHLTSSAVSHHLKLLKQAGLVISRREGKEVYYAAADTQRTHILHDMTEQIIEISCPTAEQFEESHSYDSQIGAISQVHSFLTEDLTRRWTIEELSARFHINPTTLKTEFKRVFGQPIGTYMKHYRMKQAAQLLRQTDLSITEIAARVGYENGSKFTQAFRDVHQILPKDYRKSKKSG